MTGVSSRDLARAAGETRYFTGRECRNGHLAERRTSDGRCIDCARGISIRDRAVQGARKNEKDRAYQKANAERIKAHRHAYYEKNKAAIRVKNDEWLASHPENVAQMRARTAEKGKAEPAKEAKRKRSVEYRRENADKVRSNRAAWNATHKELKRSLLANYRAKKRAAPGRYTPADVERIRKAQSDRCAYCRTKLRGKGHVDHIIALSKGGSNWPSNLQLTCVSCNTSKHAKDPIYFAQTMGMLL